MGERDAAGSSLTSAVIAASREAISRAFTEPAALEAWQAREGMTARVHAFDGRAGGGCRMSLFYPAAEPSGVGKTGEWEDRHTAWFVELDPPARIVEAIVFDTADTAFAGEMAMTVTLAEVAGGASASCRAWRGISSSPRTANRRDPSTNSG